MGKTMKENEDFCVKGGPNEDYFSSLVLIGPSPQLRTFMQPLHMDMHPTVPLMCLLKRDHLTLSICNDIPLTRICLFAYLMTLLWI